MVVILTIFAILFVLFMIGVYQKYTNAMCTSKKTLQGKTVIVTGGTAGMGLEIAKDLAARGARVIIACPFTDEGAAARRLIIEQTGNLNVIFKLLDLASLESVKRFAADIMNTEDRLDILMNNAGVGTPGDFLTDDGLQFILQVNYYGHFQLTLLLLPLLKKTGTASEPSRIVNTASVMHWIANVDVDNLNRTGFWYILQIYANSKICVVLFAHELSKRLKGSNVVVNSVDPGFVGTNIFASFDKIIGAILTRLAASLFKTPWQGAQTALYVALESEGGKVSGGFFKNCRLTRASKAAYDGAVALSLWKESLRLVKLDFVE